MTLHVIKCSTRRLKLVAVMLSPETGPGPGPEVQSCSADTQKSLLGSLAAFQQDRRQAHARTSEARDPGPVPQPSAVTPENRPSSSSAAAASASHSSIPAREHDVPSAPPLPMAHEVPASNSAASTSKVLEGHCSQAALYCSAQQGSSQCLLQLVELALASRIAGPEPQAHTQLLSAGCCRA